MTQTDSPGTDPTRPSILTTTSAEDLFRQQTAAEVVGGIQALIVQVYLPRWSKFWGVPIASGQQQLVQQTSTLSIPKRVAALGTAAVSLFEFNTALKTFIEGVVQQHIDREGVPPAGSNLAFVLPFMAGTAFSLPGVPIGYKVDFAADGSAVCSEA